VDENEFKAYRTLRLLENANLSTLERAKEDRKLIQLKKLASEEKIGGVDTT